MIISPIDNSQRIAAKVAGLAGLFTVAIVVFANAPRKGQKSSL